MMREAERAAELLGATVPIRIDVRRFNDSADSKFALFDVNMKPARDLRHCQMSSPIHKNTPLTSYLPSCRT